MHGAFLPNLVRVIPHPHEHFPEDDDEHEDEREHVMGQGPNDFVHHGAVLLCQIVGTTDQEL
jgi:hypothetical protein